MDPEAESVLTGRRIVPKHDLVFAGGEPSLDALGRAIVASLRSNDPGTFHALRLTRREFSEILWPEFPESRPATNIDAAFAWGLLSRRSLSGVAAAFGEHGGQKYELVRVETTLGTMEYTNFRLHRGIVLVVRDEQGEEQRLTFVRSFAERRGKFRVYSLED